MSKLGGARWGLVLALCVGGACGDDAKSGDDGGECSTKFEACGGDLVGTWQYTSACLSDAPEIPAEGAAAAFAKCDDKPKVDFTVDLEGQAEFGKDGSFSAEQSVSLRGGLRVSKSCLAQAAKSMGVDALSCDDIDGTPDGTDCILELGDDETSELETSGTYTVSGKELTVTAADADASDPAEPTPYCVRGDTLTARITIGDTGMTVVYRAKRK
jgi:hypothetical protein